MRTDAFHVSDTAISLHLARAPHALFHRHAEGFCRRSLGDEACPPFSTHAALSPTSVTTDGRPAKHRFDDRERNTLLARGHYEHVIVRPYCADVVGVAGEDHPA